jgi:hypothetical protein
VRIDRPAESDEPRPERPERRAAGAPPDVPPAARHETRDRATYAAEYRATVDAVYREHRAARAWDEAAPALREAWTGHEKKWSSPERPGPPPQPETPGSWRGDGGRYLAPDANAEADRGCARIREAGETAIIPAVRRIEAEDSGRRLAGLEYCFKGEDRLKEKVARTLEEQPALTAGQAVSAVPDAVRFTFCYPGEYYSAGVRADLDRLSVQGFELARPLKNSWGSDQYRGINTQWREPETGQLFEVQFHTRASFEAKQLTHGAYERIRDPQTPEAELDELEDFQRQVCGKIPVPPGATEV